MTQSGTRALLACGIISSLLYAAMNVFIPPMWPEYNVASQTVSELSAVGAPTRPIWVITAIVYTMVYAGFGWGVLSQAPGKSRLRPTGLLIITQGVFGLFWPPMQQRGNEFALTDAMHIAFAAVTLTLMLVTMGFGASAMGRAFKRYSVATVLTFLVFGVLTGIESPGIASNLPTPWIGVWERINIAAFLLWVGVLSVALMRATKTVAASSDHRADAGLLNSREARRT